MGRINKSYLKQLAERKKFELGGLSTEGYRRDSPDVDNPYNVIPSNYISMDDVDFPIYAVSNAGDEDILYPGEERVFSGDYVTEFPLKNMGNKRYDQTGMYQLGGTNIDLKLPQFGEDKPRPFFEITGAGTGPQYDMFGYGYVPLGKNLGISADLMRWKEGDWRGGGYGISGNINIPINRGERKIRPTVKDPVMFQGGGTKGYKPDFRSKSQIANEQGTTSESTAVTPKINPVSKRLIDEANYERLKSQQPSFNQGYKKTASDIERSDYYRKQKELRDALKNVDVVTDVMQVGNFIPHPAAQVIGKVGNWLGAATDITQAGTDYGNQDYGNMTMNLGSAVLSGFLGSKGRGYMRDMYNTNPGSMADKIASFGSRSGSYRPLTTLPRLKNNPAIQRGLNYNRAVLTALGAETAYDAGAFDNNTRLGLPIKPINVNKPNYQGGGTMLAEPDYDIYKAPKQGNYLLPDINRPYYTDEQGGNRSEYKMGFNINGKETLLPTVVGGRQLTPEETINRYRQTGLHMGQYNTPEEAEYAARLRTAKYNMLQDPVRFNASMFQMGGTMGIPGVNGQVVSSGPTPLTSVKKTRGPISKNSKGDIKTMSPKAVKQTLKYSKQKPNKI